MGFYLDKIDKDNDVRRYQAAVEIAFKGHHGGAMGFVYFHCEACDASKVIAISGALMVPNTYLGRAFFEQKGVYAPEGWFMHENMLYCPKHQVGVITPER
ncbi:hypothetical protein CMI37_20380 [Candidatus Pacearchaeota archaeon]|jgi:hypothetical protein|nr:hypothetical protein [Candidatus Pacearchaeota archaeon]|tara:strand:- start:6396 stop:6695 length:300 start_codon:yes stop_codon:yes gene_type:complete